MERLPRSVAPVAPLAAPPCTPQSIPCIPLILSPLILFSLILSPPHCNASLGESFEAETAFVHALERLIPKRCSSCTPQSTLQSTPPCIPSIPLIPTASRPWASRSRRRHSLRGSSHTQCNSLLHTHNRASLGESFEAETAFVHAMERFFGAPEDAVSIATGGPVLGQFVMTLRDLTIFKETLKSQMRERFLSLKKGIKAEVAAEADEDLQNARMQFEQARFNLMTALSSAEAKKKHVFLESIGSAVHAHLRYFKQSICFSIHSLPSIRSLSQTELAERIYQFRRTQEEESAQLEAAHTHAQAQALAHAQGRGGGGRMSGAGPGGAEGGAGGEGFGQGRGPYRPSGGVTSTSVEQMMRAGAGGQRKVQVIKQGYLVRRTAAARSRHFFVLDSRGSLYYHKDAQNARSDTLSSLFSLVRPRTADAAPAAPPPANPMAQHYRPLGVGGRGGGGGHGEDGGDEHGTDAMGMGMGGTGGMGGMSGMGGMGEEEERNHSLLYESLNLLTATVKMDADEPDLRFCFRLVTPDCTHTLQAESAAEQRDWMEKITAVIASLLNSHTTAQPAPSVADLTISHRAASQDGQAAALPIVERPLEVLGYVSGNDRCADCSRAHPDWASLNLCVLLCIDCSGVHRNLGVHRSKVRSLTLDVKVWTAPLVRLMAIVGNDFANSVWEQGLKDVQGGAVGGREGPPGAASRALTRAESEGGEGEDYILLSNDGGASAAAPAVVHKPSDTDSLAVKEQYIHCKYVERRFQAPATDNPLTALHQLRAAVASCDVRSAFRLLVTAPVDVNADVVGAVASATPAGPGITRGSAGRTGQRLLHVACERGDEAMVELLLLWGAVVNVTDGEGRTPMQVALQHGNHGCSKLLASRV
ncbi:unnamed protein product [Closterium sp. Yama58-4]|nr:unnamed protein product [Closterium sp. Yama58-4]